MNFWSLFCWIAKKIGIFEDKNSIELAEEKNIPYVLEHNCAFTATTSPASTLDYKEFGIRNADPATS